MHIKSTSVLVLVGALAGLAGCNGPDQPLPAHTRAWLHETAGSTMLRFGQPGTGAIDTVRLEVTETNDWLKHPGKLSLGGYRAERVVAEYQRPLAGNGANSTGLRLELQRTGNVYFYPFPASMGYTLPMAQVATSTIAADELLSGNGSYSTVELLDNTSLNGRRYGRLAHVLLHTTPTPAGIQEFWYAKETGLAAYALGSGPVWYRL